MRRSVSWAGASALALMCGLAACSSSTTAPPAAPEGHTVMKGGVAHAPGLNDPAQNCVTCHGATFQGGTSGQPSCYSCHGAKW